ncbi:autotransporter outer membrane beta-barrel domain-containing protein [Novosphingobium flavum]|uniref:Autotransporter outer membrane beta-barrel domain-containing protein n=1 Tax=Novosphingobium flavum TaxID=1778672 RepID=A0A7X1FS40_9SPHN|nr:autotransporter outer membrane beta-barrel domain-containing protein [Novosphingobium flavum]MBC2665347.1 autotransporter outer membrane beta-barrel domain-containing protein [Novosphingobium flavum]
MNSVFSTRRNGAILAAATSIFALCAPAHGQSVCTQGGTAVTCTNGGATGTIDATAAVGTVVGQGLQLSDTADLNATLGGAITTSLAAPSLIAVPVGNLTIAAGSGGGLNLANTGIGAGALLVAGTGAVNATLGSIATVNDYGLLAVGTGVTATTGAITATNVTATDVVLPVSIVFPAGASVGAGAAGIATTGNSTLTVNGNLGVAGTTNPLVGLVAYAPAGAASATVNGGVNVTTANSPIGVAAIGSTGATVRVTGATGITGISGTALAAITDTGTASVTCGGAVTATGNDSSGVYARGPVVNVSCGNITATGTGTTGLEAAGGTSLTATVGAVSANGAGSTAILLNETGVLPTIGTVDLTGGNVAATGTGSVGVNINGSSIIARLGTVNTAGAGVILNSPGAITLTSGNIATTGATAPGVLVIGGAGAVSLTTGTVTTIGTTSAGINASTTSGNLTVNSGLITSTGPGLIATTGSGNQLLTVNGVQSAATGISAVATGTGAITVTGTAPVSGTAGYGIFARGTTGTLTVNAAGATGALGAINLADSGAGTINVTLTGGTTTSAGADAVHLVTLGADTVTVNSGATVTGQGANDAIDLAGTLGNTVTINGTANMATGATGYLVNAAGGATTVAIGATGNAAGAFNLTGNNDSLTNGGTLTLAGTSNFGLGTDGLNNNAVLNLTTGATVNGLETLNNNASGTVNAVGTTTLTGTTVNNAGQLVAVGGTASLAGLAAFNNTGLITMVDGAANDTLTINGPFAGSGASRLAVDVDGGLNTADKLIVNGNVTGSTVIDVNLVGSPLYNPTGVIVVDSTGTVSAGAFTLAPADAQIGFLNYGLRQVGNDTFIASTLDPSFTALAAVGSMGQDLWYQSFDAYHDAIMGRHAGSLVTGSNVGIWGQLYESKDRYGDDNRTAVVNGTTITYSDKLRTHRRGAQVGLEFRGTGFVIGATGGYEWARSEEQPVTARIKAEGYNYGAYAHFGMASGLYAGVLLKRDDYHIDFANDARAVGFRSDAHSTGVDGEIGLKTGSTGSIAFDLNAGLSYVKTSIDAWNQYGLNFDWQHDESMRGRLGARVLFPSAWGAFLGAKVMHEFKDDGYLHVANTATVADIDMAQRGTWVRLEGGLMGIARKGVELTVWGDLGSTKSFGGRIGFAF